MNKRVLIVDDEMPIRQWLEFTLKKHDGYEIVGLAKNGAEGLSVFKKTSPNIIITDIRMPIIDGFEMLRSIYEMNGEVFSIMITSHEDFEYARSAIKLGVSEYILKTEITEELLLESLSKFEERIASKLDSIDDVTITKRNHFLRSLVSSDNSKPMSNDVFVENRVNIADVPYLVIDVRKTPGTEYDFDIPINQILYNQIKLPIDEWHYCIIANLNQTFVSHAQIIDQIRQLCLSMVTEGVIAVGCSDIGNKKTDLAKYMNEARCRANLSFYNPERKIFLNESTSCEMMDECEKAKAVYGKAVINQNYSYARQVIEQTFSILKENEYVNINYIKNLSKFFISTLMYAIKDDVEGINTTVQDIEKHINVCISIDKLEKILLDEFDNTGAAKNKTENYSNTIKNAIRYMEDNYSKSISLHDVSDNVGLSAEYLSRLFKEETGIKFIVYLNNIKMKHAMRLLEEGDKKIYEIASAVGYSNLSYFSTTFKRKFGKNPFEYKQGK